MGIYNTEGELDLVEAAAELDAQTTVTNRPAAEFVIGKIEAAALLDIAGSLRVLATESSFAMQAAGVIEVNLSAEPEVGATVRDVRPEDAPAGSRVRLIVGAEGELIEGTLTGAMGVDQGERWVVVDWDAGGVVKAWADELEVISLPGAIVELANGTVLGDGVTPATLPKIRESDTPLVGVATEAETPALRTDEDEDGDEAVGGYELANTTADPDDLDDDFAGDEHPAAVDAIAALKAREKAAKAAKAKKGKKP